MPCRFFSRESQTRGKKRETVNVCFLDVLSFLSHTICQYDDDAEEPTANQIHDTTSGVVVFVDVIVVLFFVVVFVVERSKNGGPQGIAIDDAIEPAVEFAMAGSALSGATQRPAKTNARPVAPVGIAVFERDR